MKYIAFIIAILALGGCAAGQRYAECDKKFPPPPNTFLLRNQPNGGVATILLGYLAEKAAGDDEDAYYQWQKNITACTNEKTASQ